MLLRTIVGLGLFSTGAIASAVESQSSTNWFESLKVSGFVDFRNSTYHYDKSSSGNYKEKSGYLLEDGALYFHFNHDKVEALVDLPFHRNSTTGTNDANFAFAMTKAQAWVGYSFTEEFKIVAGQFDTLYGFELNDSKDRLFGNAGLVYAQTLPIVHSGVYLQYSHSGLTAKLLSANPADRDTLGTTANDSYMETGATVGYSQDWIRGQLGYLTRDQKSLSGGEAKRTLTDILLGFTFDAFDLDLQYSIVKNPQKNTLTTSATDDEDSGKGLMAILAYKLSDDWKLGVRYESLTDDPGASNYNKAESWSGVVHFIANSHLTMRAEWMDINTTRRADFAADAYGENRFDIGALLVF
ncbi:MAG: outer membrane beta-barrel protein [Bdellovibrionales bacterium]